MSAIHSRARQGEHPVAIHLGRRPWTIRAARLGPRRLVPLLLLLAACADPASLPAKEAAATPPAAVPPAPLSQARLLRRLSLDLRGVTPTVDELEALATAPDPIPAAITRYLDDPRLEGRLVERMNEHWLTGIEGFFLHHADYGPAEPNEAAFDRAIGEEPLRLLAAIAVSDRPYTDIVTADWTMANPMLASLWPLDYPADGVDWMPAHYTDGRPPGGVLMTNGLWWRYYSNATNFNRSRAAATAALLLCEDYFDRPVTFAATPAAVEQGLESALRADPACLTCHATLDPLADAFFGFWYYDQFDPTEQSTYHPSREHLGPTLLGVEPAWFGQPFHDPAELGPLVAADPRFAPCAVKSAARAFWGRPVDPVADFAQLEEINAAFVAGDLRYKALLAALLAGPDYEAADESPRLLTVGQLESSLEDLTGFVWTEDGDPLLHDDVTGYRVLGGGLDADTVTAPAAAHGLGRELVLRELAALAAAAGAHHDLVTDPAAARLFTAITLDTQPGDPEFDAQLAILHARLHADAPADPAADAALWSEVAAVDGPEAAWAALLAGMLRDPAYWSL